ncbi:MAG: hypothetical protein ACPGSI_15285 [Pikeienuella sp.]
MANEAKHMMNNAAMKAAVQGAMKGMDAEKDLAELIASVRRTHFDAYIRKGFTPDQALVLCQNRAI